MFISLITVLHILKVWFLFNLETFKKYFSNIEIKKPHAIAPPVNNVKVGAYVLKDGFKRHKARGLDDKDAWFHSLVNYCGGSHEIAKKEMMYYKEGLLDTKSILIKNPDSTDTKVKVKGA